MNILFKAYFGQTKILKKFVRKIHIGKDPDPEPDPHPDVFKSRIRIRSKIVRIRNTAVQYLIYAFNAKEVQEKS
jgi:hypothetical protein